MKIWITVLLILMITCSSAVLATAQEDSKLPPTDEEQEKEKAEKEKRAFLLLEQVVDEAQLLKLPENRIRVQINAADLLWQRDQARARTLFSLAADGVTEMLRSAMDTSITDRRNFNQSRTPAQLRQELVLTVARHDAPLAYQLLASTRQSTPAAAVNAGRSANSEDNLDQRLLAQVASLDPRLALQNAEQLLEKGQYPRALAEVLAQLKTKDKEAGAKLEDKMLKRLASANLLAAPDAGGLAIGLLQPGPRPAESSTKNAIDTSTNSAALAQPAYENLLGAAIDAALKATPQSSTNQRGQNRGRGRGGAGTIGGGSGVGSINVTNAAPTDLEIEQGNARRLLGGLQMLLPQIEQYLPARAQAVRQKIADLGLGNNPRAEMAQVINAMQQGTSESMLSAATTAPPAIQSKIYQQAALKAMDEGNAERARQIANEHLDPAARESLLQTLEFREVADKTEANKIDDVRQTLSRLRNDSERIDLLLRLSDVVREKNPNLATQLLDEAKRFTDVRASGYQRFEQQLKVAEAFKDLQPTRSFEVLEPGIIQLNELLAAAATLSGFEVNVFKDGELPLETRNELSNMVSRYGQTLSLLAKNDFDRAQTMANRFQLAEPRILVRLAIIRGVLGVEATQQTNRSRRFGPNTLMPLP
jgi:hypothetical protein